MAVLRAAGLAWSIEQWGDPASSRTPLLLLHGFTGKGTAWRPLAEPLARLRRCIAPDLPGHGASDAPPEGFDLERAAEGLRDLLDALEIPRVRAAGYSMGGRLALQFAVSFPARLERLVLTGASPGIEDSGERASRAAADEIAARRLLAVGLPSFVDEWMAQPLFAAQLSLPPERLRALREEKLSHSPEGLAAALRAFGPGRQKPLHAALSRIAVPVLLVVGEKDGKYQRIGASMAAALPDARLVIVKGAGHAPQVEAPGPFFEAVAPFLEAAGSEG